MKKPVFLIISFLLCALLFNSCQQCNTTKEPVKTTTDTIGIPKLDIVNTEIKKDSLNPFLYYRRARIYEATGDLKSAGEDIFRALSIDSTRPEFFLYAADLFKKTGEPRRGIALMNKAIATDSTNTDYYVKAALLSYIDTTLKGNYRLALNYLNAAIQKDPQNADIYFYKGNIFREMRDTSRAMSSYQTAIELNPKYYDAYLQMGLMLQKRKDKNAEKYFDNAIKIKDKPEDALYLKADLIKQEGVALLDANKYAQADTKFMQAIDNFKKVIDLNYHNVEAYMGIAFSYYQMDSTQQAYRYYQLATKIDPTYAGAYFSQGLCAEDLGRTKEAINLYQACLNIDPKFKRAEEHLKKLQPAQ